MEQSEKKKPGDKPGFSLFTLFHSTVVSKYNSKSVDNHFKGKGKYTVHYRRKSTRLFCQRYSLKGDNIGMVGLSYLLFPPPECQGDYRHLFAFC